MAEHLLLENLGIIVVAGTATSLLARAAGIPSIVAYIVAGLLVGPALGVVEFTHTMELIAEAGIVLLLFLVGLEISFDKIREVGPLALGAGAAQMVVTALAVASVAVAVGADVGDAAFLGIALTFSSTVVVVKILEELRQLDSRHGRVAIGILLVQDLAVLVVLTIVSGVDPDGSPDPVRIGLDIGRAFFWMVMLFGAAALAAWKVLPRLLGYVARSQAALLTCSLAWCFLLVSGAEVLGLSLELGAFLAGLALAQLPYSRELRRRVHPLMDFFVAVFFVSLGARMEVGAALSAWPLVLAICGVTVLGKPPLVAWLVRHLGETKAVSARAGLSLGQTSEFSFILAGVAAANGLVGEEMLSIVAAVGLVSIGVSSLTIPAGDRLLPKEPSGTAGSSPDERPTRLSDHVIVVGMNSLGRLIAEYLTDQGERVLALDTDLEKLEGLPCSTFLGNAEYLSVLEDAGIGRARLLVSALHIEDMNRLLAYRAFRLGVPSVIHSFDQSIEEELESLDVAHLLNSREASVARITEALREAGVFGGAPTGEWAGGRGPERSMGEGTTERA